MTPLFLLLLVLAAVAGALAYLLHRAQTELSIERAACRHLRGECSRAHERAEQAIERLHAVSDSALRGHPMVQWRHPAPQPASDLWYWRARFDGTEYLFTEEAVRTARQRASLLLPAGREVTTSAVAKSEAPAGGAALQPTA